MNTIANHLKVVISDHTNGKFDSLPDIQERYYIYATSIFLLLAIVFLVSINLLAYILSELTSVFFILILGLFSVWLCAMVWEYKERRIVKLLDSDTYITDEVEDSLTILGISFPSRITIRDVYMAADIERRFVKINSDVERLNEKT